MNKLKRIDSGNDYEVLDEEDDSPCNNMHLFPDQRSADFEGK